MTTFYPITIIPSILKNFKINSIILLGCLEKKLFNEILAYGSSVTLIDFNKSGNLVDVINDYPLNALPKLNNYDAIFINDDPNWYTLFNELKIIKDNNVEFPLTFVCNNKFPHKYRDTYFNPNCIPKKYRHNYSKELPIFVENESILISDGKFHACEENTLKNGVSVAIDDFLKENPDITRLNINFIEEITILFSKSTINQIRINKFYEENENNNLKDLNLSDKLLENKALASYISKYDIGDNSELIDDFEAQKEKMIKEYEEKISIQNSELYFKNNQIESMKTDLELKDYQIVNLESILFNKENELVRVQRTLQDMEYNQKYFKNKIAKKESELRDNEANLNNRRIIVEEMVNEKNKKIVSLFNQILFADNRINSLENELSDAKNSISSLKKECFYQNNKLTTNKYYLNLFKEELLDNQFEIQHIKTNSFIKKILSPFSYFYLIFKSNPKEISTNIKLFRLLKNKDCFNIGFYLRNYKDIQKSIWDKYFSPELHYVCHGFDEKRIFNRKYYNFHSKKELLNYILNCVEK